MGKHAGFCYGVENAVNGAIKELEKKEGGAKYCLGEIVHNKQVVEELEQKGLEVVENLDEAKEKVIIRAHGVAKTIYQEAKKLNLELIDHTCPNVLKIHKIAKQYIDDVEYIVLVGQKKHPENIGTISHCGENSKIIETKEEINELLNEIKNISGNNIVKKVLLIVQTTFSLEKFKEIEEILSEELEKINIECIVKNTICRATEIRQIEAKEISEVVDCMIIIGGKNSSNTKKLYEIAKRNCENTICIETVKELEIDKNIKKIGIMAGASTPKKSIEDVEKYLKEV